jgi:hypothetical protein
MSRRDERDESENGRGKRPVRKSGMSPLIPVTLAAVVIGGIGLSMLGKDPPKAPEANAADAKPKPFANLPPEAPPQRGGGSRSGRTFVAQAPEGLAKNETWQKALKIASEGEALYKEAVDAKAAQDTAKANEKGRAARIKLDEAFTMTAGWEEELLEKYGDANVEVRQIVQMRTGWVNKLDWLLKSVGRS